MEIDGGPPIRFATTDEIIKELRKRGDNFVFASTVCTKKRGKKSLGVSTAFRGSFLEMLGLVEVCKSEIIRSCVSVVPKGKK